MMRTLAVATVVAAVAVSGFAYAAGAGNKVPYTGYYLDGGGNCRSFGTVDVVVDKKFCQGPTTQCKAGTSPCFADGQLACVAPNKVSPRNKACLK